MTRLLGKTADTSRAEPDPACVKEARRAVTRAGWDAGRDLKVFATAEEAIAQGCERCR